MIAIDTSVVVAAFATWHEGHSDAVRVLAREPSLPAHAAIETYSVLTRFPMPYRVPHPVVAEYLDRMFPARYRLLPRPATARNLPRIASQSGIGAGGVYDALIGLVARDAGATLVTRDRRAMATYQALGVDVELNA